MMSSLHSEASVWPNSSFPMTRSQGLRVCIGLLNSRLALTNVWCFSAQSLLLSPHHLKETYKINSSFSYLDSCTNGPSEKRSTLRKEIAFKVLF